MVTSESSLQSSRTLRNVFVYAGGLTLVIGGGIVTAYNVLGINTQQIFNLQASGSLSAPSVPCLVEPLPTITDPTAVAWEQRFGPDTGAVDREGLTSRTARALERFEKLLTKAGATLTLHSAYRPAAYQAHLQQVWEKWMYELRDNIDPACSQFKSEVYKEFTHHGLLPSQRPATTSDHTRGLAFDATVDLTDLTSKARRRFSVDKVARSCKLRRPNILHDPVHFKLVG